MDVVMISLVQIDLSILFVQPAGGRQFNGINALITTQEGVRWRMDVSILNWKFGPLKVWYRLRIGHTRVVRERSRSNKN
jgi:hypothetical protein